MCAWIFRDVQGLSALGMPKSKTASPHLQMIKLSKHEDTISWMLRFRLPSFDFDVMGNAFPLRAARGPCITTLAVCPSSPACPSRLGGPKHPSRRAPPSPASVRSPAPPPSASRRARASDPGFVAVPRRSPEAPPRKVSRRGPEGFPGPGRKAPLLRCGDRAPRARRGLQGRQRSDLLNDDAWMSEDIRSA